MEAKMVSKVDEVAQLQQTPSLGDGQIQGIVIAGPPIRKQFSSFLNIIAFAFVICNSWAGVAGSIQLALLQGGPPTLIYGLFISSIAYMSVALSMAELSSVYPTAGGQYHFASILAPRRIKRGISYACGLLAMMSWIAIGAAVTIIPSQQIMALVTVYNPGFVAKQWHVFLIYQGLAVAILLYNIFALKRTPWMHNIGFGLTLCLFLAGTITLLVRATPKAPSEFVWSTFINYTGWPDGACFITGLSTTCFMYIGLDGAMHIVEECEQPTRTVPMAMVSAVGIGFVTALVYSIAQLYALTDIDQILTTTEFVPVLVLQQGFRSSTGATVFVIMTIIMALFILNAIQETSSRLAWSFARDNGLVFSSRLSRMHPTLEVPVGALLMTWSILVICGCIFVASKTAFNALIGSSVVLQEISFLIPVALLLYRRRSAKYLPPSRPWNLPPWLGWTANIIVVVFGVVTAIFFNFPFFLPTTPDSMNYTCVILGIALVLGVVNWFAHAQRHYQGPTIRFAEDGSGQWASIAVGQPEEQSVGRQSHEI